jgi:hypothetical protein
VPRLLRAEARYELHEQIGVGGTALVYRATMLSAAGGRPVVAKMLGRDRALVADAERRLIAEARLAYSLVHANLCQIVDLVETDEGTFIMMEHVQGLDLLALLERLPDQRLDVASALHIAREVAQGLDYAHRHTDARGQPLVLMHGDVSPANILVSCAGEVKLADFGIARALGAAAPGNEVRGATEGFAAPEAAEPGVDQRADIYSLGMTLSAMLSGPRQPPARPAGLRHERPEVSAALVAIVERATAARREQRYLSAGDLARALTIELARSHASFSPAALGLLVRGCADGDATVVPGPGAHASEPDEGKPWTSSWRRSPRTRTMPPASQSRRVWAAAVIATVLLIGGLFAHRRRAPTTSAMPGATSATPGAPLSFPRETGAAPRTLVTPESLPDPTPPRELPRGDGAPLPLRPAGFGYLTVTAVPWGALVVDGRRVAEVTPVYRLRLAAGEHRASVLYGNSKDAAPVRRVVIKPDKVTIIGFTRD